MFCVLIASSVTNAVAVAVVHGARINEIKLTRIQLMCIYDSLERNHKNTQLLTLNEYSNLGANLDPQFLTVMR